MKRRPSDKTSTATKRVLERLGAVKGAKRLGVSSGTAARIAAGMAVQPGSLAVVQQSLLTLEAEAVAS